MKKNKTTYYLLFILVLSSCSTKKNTFISRNYHNLTAHYNAFFNGNESFKEGVSTVETGYVDNYKNVLPIYRFPGEENTIEEQLKRSIEKGSKVIHKHSIYIKDREYCNWVDDSYLLIGKSNFYEGNYDLAIENFEYVSKKYRTNQLKFEGLMWLVQSYIQQKEYAKALEFIDIIKNDPFYLELIETKEEKEERIKNETVPTSTKKKRKPKKEKRKDRIKDGNLKKLQGQFEAVQANYYLKLKDNEKAITHLEKSIEHTRKKKVKKRYQFILGQLYQKQGDYQKAYPLFESVAKKGPSYVMEFNAKIQLAMSTGADNTEKVKQLLLEMAADAKNKDYLGQIYFALAGIYYKEGDTVNAIETYKLSAQLSKDNEDKSVSFLRLAEMLYQIPDYKQASVYYDSTMIFLPTENPSYSEAKRRKEALSYLVKNLEIIYTQDSLQNLASLSPKELKDHIKKQQQIKEEDSFLSKQAEQMASFNNTQTNTAFNSTGWYFYNSNTRKTGYNEFVKNWKNRVLEDNWRRSIKASTNTDLGDDAQNNTDKPEINTDVASVEDNLEDIPNTPEQKEVSDKKIQEAMYSNALIYKEDLKTTDQSVKVCQELLDRYAAFELKPAVYYHLYRIYRDQKSSINATRYKQLLIEEFPESDYAKILDDANYLDATKETAKKEEISYNELYKLYLKEDFVAIYSLLQNIEETFSLEQYQSKAYYIKALSIQKTEGLEAYKRALQLLVFKFPNTEPGILAKEILAVIM